MINGDEVMVVGNLEFTKEYERLGDDIIQCFNYARQHDLKNYIPGIYHIDEDKIFLNIVEYMTTTVEQKFWEAHRNYIDIHLVLEGIEQIDLNFIHNMIQKDFIEEKDFLPLEGEAKSLVQLNVKDFVICYPEDGHRTGIQVEKPGFLKKAIFKIKI